MGSDAQEQDYYDSDKRRLHATRKGQRRDGGSAYVKRDCNEVGDRYHLIALI
jgi:hypothetical protein